MILRRLFTLTALTVAALLSVSDRANANYDVSTSIQSTTGLTLLQSLPAGAGNTTLINGVLVSTAAGGAKYQDNAGTGSTIWLINFFQGNFPVGPLVTPAIFVYVTTPSNLSDNSSWSFVENITVTNPTGSGNTGSFTQSASYVMNVLNGAGSATGTPTGLSPPSITVSGTIFNISNPQATSTTANNVNGAAVSSQISAIPEPTSVVMLGVGLAGVVGLGLRRKKRQV